MERTAAVGHGSPRARRRSGGRVPGELGSRREALPRGFYERGVLGVARDLLGANLVRDLGGERRLVGRIVEVEAYDGPDDLACHASRGRTLRTEPMFGLAGHAYVYLVYGMHHCLNVVTGPVGYPAAVLLRAVEPLSGIEWMNARPSRPASIASGPGRLTRAFHVDLSLNRADLCARGSGLHLEPGERVPARTIARGPRIGVDYAGRSARLPWRFGLRGHASLSKPFAARPR